MNKSLRAIVMWENSVAIFKQEARKYAKKIQKSFHELDLDEKKQALSQFGTFLLVKIWVLTIKLEKLFDTAENDLWLSLTNIDEYFTKFRQEIVGGIFQVFCSLFL